MLSFAESSVGVLFSRYLVVEEGSDLNVDALCAKVLCCGYSE